MASGQWAEALKNYVEDYDIHGVRVPTGFPTIDDVLRGGMAPGRFYMLLGRTSTGKSNIVFNMAYHALSPDYSIAIVSLEMSTPEVIDRMLSIHGGMALDDVPDMVLSNEPQETILTSLNKFQNLYINDTPGMGLSEVDDWIQDINTTAPPVRLIILDHLLLLGNAGGQEISAPTIMRMSDECKAYAKYSESALLTIHQTGRGESKDRDEGHKPVTLSSGMYAGEQSSSVTFGMYRPSRKPDLSPMAFEQMKKDLIFQVVKNRHGEELPLGVALEWDLPTMTVKEKYAESESRAARRPTPHDRVVVPPTGGAPLSTAAYDTAASGNLRGPLFTGSSNGSGDS